MEIRVYGEDARNIRPGDTFSAVVYSVEGRQVVKLLRDGEDMTCGTCGEVVPNGDIEAHLKEKHFG